MYWSCSPAHQSNMAFSNSAWHRTATALLSYLYSTSNTKCKTF